MTDELKPTTINPEANAGQSTETPAPAGQSDVTTPESEQEVSIGQLIKEAKESSVKDPFEGKTREEIIESYNNLRGYDNSLKNEMDNFKRELELIKLQRQSPEPVQIQQPTKKPTMTVGQLVAKLNEDPNADLSEVLAPLIDERAKTIAEEKLQPLYQKENIRAEAVIDSYLEEWKEDDGIEVTRQDLNKMGEELQRASTDPNLMMSILHDIYVGRNLPNALKQVKTKRESVVATKQANAAGTFAGGIGASNIPGGGKPLTQVDKDKMGAQQFLGKVR